MCVCERERETTATNKAYTILASFFLSFFFQSQSWTQRCVLNAPALYDNRTRRRLALGSSRTGFVVHLPYRHPHPYPQTWPERSPFLLQLPWRPSLPQASRAPRPVRWSLWRCGRRGGRGGWEMEERERERKTERKNKRENERLREKEHRKRTITEHTCNQPARLHSIGSRDRSPEAERERAKDQ